MMIGLGGDLFVLYWDAEAEELSGLNASGPAPCGSLAGFSREARQRDHHAAGMESTAVTVPGAVDGWAQLHKRFRNLPWKRLVSHPQSRMRIKASQSQKSSEEQWTIADFFRTIAEANAESSRVFLPGGKASASGRSFQKSRHGSRLQQPSLRAGSRTHFMKERSPAAIFKTSKRLGGMMNAARFVRVLSRVGGTAFRSITAAGGSTNCRPTGRAWPRSKC